MDEVASLRVVYGAMLSVASEITAVARSLADVAGAVGGVETGNMPPKTGAALERALAAWPAAIRRLAASMHAAGDGLRAAVQTYGDTDRNIAANTGLGGLDGAAPYDAAGTPARLGPHLDVPSPGHRPSAGGGRWPGSG